PSPSRCARASMVRTLPSWAQGLAPIATPAPITSWSSPKIARSTTGCARWRRSPARGARTSPRRAYSDLGSSIDLPRDLSQVHSSKADITITGSDVPLFVKLRITLAEHLSPEAAQDCKLA